MEKIIGFTGKTSVTFLLFSLLTGCWREKRVSLVDARLLKYHILPAVLKLVGVVM